MTVIESRISEYEDRGSAKSSERTYRSHIDHYRFTWGGQLPASSEKVVEYLATYAAQYKVSTMRQRLSAISKWHTAHGFYDPTTTERVTKVMRGIAKTHQTPPRQAYPLTFDHLVAICERLREERAYGRNTGDRLATLRATRDLSLLLVGFWHGFRSDELSRIDVAKVEADMANGLRIYLSHSKTDSNAKGKTYTMKKLNWLCPTEAYLDWIAESGITEGLVFRKIDRWGNLAKTGINKQSIEGIINRVAAELFPNERRFSTHSLRHGFADWAIKKGGWDVTTLMSHVGWASIENASKYMPKQKDFGILQSGAPMAISDGLSDDSTGTLIAGDFEQV